MFKRTAMALTVLMGLGLMYQPQAKAESRARLSDRQIEKRIAGELAKHKEFSNIQFHVEDSIAALSGDVKLYADKVNAEKHVRKLKTVDGVRNHIEVAGKDVSDAELRETLANKLRYDRVGYGIVFNHLTVDVQRGQATVGGNVRDYPDRASALAIVETTPGVKDVVDEINVAPAAIADDNLRIRLANAIYNHASLQKYALDPQAPIRIVVENGHAELAGVVLNEGDRQIALMQANSVPGVFSVKNNLLIAGQ